MRKIPLKLLVAIGTEFIESENLCRVTRVTDLMFDTLDTVTGTVKVRSLRAWETLRFINAISGVTGLLPMREETPKMRKSFSSTDEKAVQELQATQS